MPVRRKNGTGREDERSPFFVPSRFSFVLPFPPRAMGKQKPEAKTTAPESRPASYTVLARRYRPQTFAELVGQSPVARALGNALTSGRVAHAYLFTGARGVGKTSTARILAKALNCEQGPTDTPCGTCSACVSIAAGEDVDVLEIDGASNNGVDDIRELRGNVIYAPARSRYKIYIIDEVHMLSKGAFNALLKTLEEPPPHVKFIFATTEVDKVPVTILSRCQRFDFPGIPLPQIVDRLRAIVTGEGMQADDEALELVARRAGGSMRDAQSLLDQLLAFGGERLTTDQVHHLLGTADDDRVAGLATALLAPDPKRALELLDEALISGLHPGELLDQLIAYWRDLMVVHVAGAECQDLSVPSRYRAALEAQAKDMGLDAILAGLDVLAMAKARLRGSSHGRTLVEMTFVRLGRLKDLVSVGQVAQWLAGATTDRAGSPPPAARPPTPVPEAVKKNSPALKAGPVELTETSLRDVWAQTLSLIGSIHARELERAGFPAIFAPNTLVLSFPAAYNQSQEFCQEPERLGRIEAALRKVTGQSWKLRLETLPGNGAINRDPPVPAPPVRPRQNGAEEAERVPIVRRAIDLMGARVIRVDDGFAGGEG
jgi:DNA polymerase-3 subunit gamma/tau